MINNKITFQDMKLAIVIAVVCFTWAWPHASLAQNVSPPLAMVDAVYGSADIIARPNQKPASLPLGFTINAGDTISTNERSKVFLQWVTGIRTSLGEVSSISLGQEQNQGGSVNVIELKEGVLRVTKESGGGNLTPYKVITPVASIEPLNYNESVDFVIEAYTPTKSAISVISGTVLVKNLTVDRPIETIVSSCHVAYIGNGKHEPDVLASKADEIIPLIDTTTIPGTVATGFICPVPMRLDYMSGRLVIPGTQVLARAE